MSEHDDFKILGGLAPAIWDQQPEQLSNQQVCERYEHCPPFFVSLIEGDYEALLPGNRISAPFSASGTGCALP